MDTTYSTEAVIEAVRQSTISAQVMGRIVELRADVGDFVKAGQVVARIDEREAAQVVASSEAQVAQARANLQNARINLERARRLLESQFVSQSAVDRAEADFKAAEAQLRAAEAGAGQAAVSKGYTTVVAPISGVISARNVEVGEMATPGKPLLTAFDPNDMRVIAEVPQSVVPEIKALSRATVEVPSVDKWIKVKSMVIIPAADPHTHSTRVRLYLAGDERDIYPGVYARAHFAIGQRAQAGDPGAVGRPAQRGERRVRGQRQRAIRVSGRSGSASRPARVWSRCSPASRPARKWRWSRSRPACLRLRSPPGRDRPTIEREESAMADIVMLGAGIGGLPMAYDMRKQARPEDNVIVVSNVDYFHFVPSNPWVAVNWRKRDDIQFPLAPYLAEEGDRFHRLRGQAPASARRTVSSWWTAARCTTTTW